MRKIGYAVCSLFILLVITGCTSKTTQNVDFDKYTMRRYTQEKPYQTISSTDETVRYQAQEQTTGVANSLMVNRFPLGSEDVQTIAQSNADQLQKKLVNYQGNNPKSFTLECGTVELTGYLLDFSYDLEQNHFYVYQYLFVDQQNLYIISFQSITNKDITAMKKSIKTLACRGDKQ